MQLRGLLEQRFLLKAGQILSGESSADLGYDKATRIAQAASAAMNEIRAAARSNPILPSHLNGA